MFLQKLSGKKAKKLLGKKAKKKPRSSKMPRSQDWIEKAKILGNKPRSGNTV